MDKNSFVEEHIEQINFNWLMFYPCLYFFSMWDAVKDANGEEEHSPFLFLPFVFAAYFVTIGLIYSIKITIFGLFLGPIFFTNAICNSRSINWIGCKKSHYIVHKIRMLSCFQLSII